MNIHTRFRRAVSLLATCALLTCASAYAQKSAVSSSDAAMLKDMAQANIAEVDAGKLATQKSSNADVKQFAQMMVDDHSSALKDTQALGEAKNVKLPTSADAKHKATMVELKTLSGKTFDSRYIKQAGLGDHLATEKLLHKVQANARDADLKSLADKMLPVVETHLQHAKDLAKM